APGGRGGGQGGRGALAGGRPRRYFRRDCGRIARLTATISCQIRKAQLKPSMNFSPPQVNSPTGSLRRAHGRDISNYSNTSKTTEGSLPTSARKCGARKARRRRRQGGPGPPRKRKTVGE